MGLVVDFFIIGCAEVVRYVDTRAKMILKNRIRVLFCSGQKTEEDFISHYVLGFLYKLVEDLFRIRKPNDTHGESKHN